MLSVDVAYRAWVMGISHSNRCGELGPQYKDAEHSRLFNIFLNIMERYFHPFVRPQILLASQITNHKLLIIHASFRMGGVSSREDVPIMFDNHPKKSYIIR